MRRAFSGTLRGKTRPLKRICLRPTRSPHSDLSYPPLRVQCAERVHQHHSSSVWQLSRLFQPLHRARLFQPLLPRTKKRLWPKTHSGPALPEPLPLQREVQDVDVEDYHVPDSVRGLVPHYRPEGCLFSHPGRTATQEVPSVCLWREGLPIQGPSLWPGLGAEDIHEVHGCCAVPFEAPGHSHAQLPG